MVVLPIPPSPSPNPLIRNSLMVKFAIYHPVTSTKTQEWLIPGYMSLASLHNSIECLANLTPFNTALTASFFLDKLITDFNIRIQDIPLNMQGTYSYTHREKCVHKLKISDIYLLSTYDIQETSLYPLLTFKTKTVKRRCELCAILYAKFICVDDHLTHKRVCYMCEKCFNGLHKEGVSCTVYPYYHD